MKRRNIIINVGFCLRYMDVGCFAIEHIIGQHSVLSAANSPSIDTHGPDQVRTGHT